MDNFKLHKRIWRKQLNTLGFILIILFLQSIFTFLVVPVIAGLAFIDSPGMLILGYPIYYFASIH